MSQPHNQPQSESNHDSITEEAARIDQMIHEAIDEAWKGTNANDTIIPETEGLFAIDSEKTRRIAEEEFDRVMDEATDKA